VYRSVLVVDNIARTYHLPTLRRDILIIIVVSVVGQISLVSIIVFVRLLHCNDVDWDRLRVVVSNTSPMLCVKHYVVFRGG
jgi:hypothetical protein